MVFVSLVGPVISASSIYYGVVWGRRLDFRFFLQLLGMDFLLVGRDDRLGEDCRLDLLIHARFCPISHGVCAWFRGCLAYPTVSGQTTIDVECRHVVVGSRGHLVTW